MVNLGLIGGFLLILAWVPMTLHTIRSKRSKSDLIFDALFLCGALLLVVYSWEIGDSIFLVLNIVAALVSGINLYYIPRKYSKLRKDVEEAEIAVHLKKRKRKSRR